MSGASELRARSYELLDVAPGVAVVDVGCGPGRAVAEMTERGARAVGVDIDERMVAAAGERWPAAGFRVANAYELPFADGELRGYRAFVIDAADAALSRAIVHARADLGPPRLAVPRAPDVRHRGDPQVTAGAQAPPVTERPADRSSRSVRLGRPAGRNPGRPHGWPSA
ncbi:class I SAM-dependent methyltransferase [Actinomadura montaniterrae]|uniref:Methyltransferase domain-containing protein n=1 Tax=Actinomadura montaniterrae TaxID=1803903 RepID=A0A6L3W396_9ACTN|nr:methyltransferase domain-containing protein [Actinomadura montaniterrae]KAB2388022.1 methyltransferase domain-containing protein [Actinomadura montaniterrae]